MSKSKRDKWLADRKNGLGGSDIPAILGLDPFNSPYSIWLSKIKSDAINIETDDMLRGKLLEPAICEYYAMKSGKRVVDTKNKLYIHPNIDYARVTPDRFTSEWLPDEIGKLNPITLGILEAKSTRTHINSNDIPKHWFAQASYVAGVTGRKKVAIAWIDGGMNFGYTEFILDDTFFEFMLGKVITFWTKYVIPKVPPPPVNVDDIHRMYRKASKGKIAIADKKMTKEYEQLLNTKLLINHLTDEKEKPESRIKLKMADAELLMSGDKVLATWKTSDDKEEFDIDTFRYLHPKLYEKYLYIRDGGRRFYLKD